MNAVFCMMLLSGVMTACMQGKADAVQAALFAGCGEAVTLCLSLAGSYALFGGLLGVMRESGMAAALAAALRRPIMRLFCFRLGEERALSDICINLSADMLGMGGAATPAGLRAMRIMAESAKERGEPAGNASRAMTLFLVMNMCSVQLLPATMIALRAQAGAQRPADIVWPTLFSTGVSALTGIALCKMAERRSKLRG